MNPQGSFELVCFQDRCRRQSACLSLDDWGTGGESRPRNLPVKGRVLCLLSYASMEIGGPGRSCTCVSRVAAACLDCSATGPWQRWQGSNLRDTRGNNPRLYRLSYIAMFLGYVFWCVQKDSNLPQRS